ncbi:MAG: transcriptional regulator PpsR [Burkholderiales bacterium]|nr:transcriptional regulator PpsR [Burkholderiales bacterium]
MKPFTAPRESIGTLDADTAGRLISAAADVALVVDREGVIRDLSFGSDELALDSAEANWVGQRWAETVTVESRPKVEALLREAGAQSAARWRQLNHPSPRGEDIPILYSAIRLGREGNLVALGRDLRTVAALQQRLVAAQQSLEREYSRLRDVETRYRLLFQLSSEAILVVDAATQRIVEANPAAGRVLGEPAARLVGRAFPTGFTEEGARAVHALLATVRAAGRAEDVRARLADGGECVVSASLFRQENAALCLVRLAPAGPDGAATRLPQASHALLEAVQRLPEGFVVTDADGRVVAANRAFLELVQLATEEQARGESLDRWFGRPGVDFNVLVANLRQHEAVRLFGTILRGEYGSVVEVEVSAVVARRGEDTWLGFSMRDVGRRLGAGAPGRPDLPRSVEQLTELIGRVSLKDLVRDTVDVVERLCIEAALELTRDNRASAAEMLGLSRQSLYVKMRRYGLGDLDGVETQAQESDE